MSRIGLKPVTIPAGVTIKNETNLVTVTGPKGELTVAIPKFISVNVEGDTLNVARANEIKQTKQNHGTVRANIHNAVVGVSEGFKKTLEIRGIGYRAAMSGTSVILNIGYSHPITVTPEEGVTITCVSATEIDVTGIDKQKVGQTSALIHNAREPEPYLGKGIRYKGEYVAQKEGKRASGK